MKCFNVTVPLRGWGVCTQATLKLNLFSNTFTPGRFVLYVILTFQGKIIDVTIQYYFYLILGVFEVLLSPFFRTGHGKLGK